MPCIVAPQAMETSASTRAQFPDPVAIELFPAGFALVQPEQLQPLLQLIADDPRTTVGRFTY